MEGLPEETRQRMRMVWIGRKHTPETLKKISDSWKHRIVTDQTREKHSRAMKGRKITWIDKVAKSLRKLTEEQAEEILQCVALGEKNTDIAARFGVSRLAISLVRTGKYFLPRRKAA